MIEQEIIQVQPTRVDDCQRWSVTLVDRGGTFDDMQLAVLPTRNAAVDYACRSGETMGLAIQIMGVESVGPIRVEQLNHSQWHILHGPCPSGVSDYVSAVADALGWGAIYRRPVETLSLDGTRLLISRARPDGEVRHG